MIACLDAAYEAPPATPQMPGARRCVYDHPAALLHHLRQLVFHAKERATQVDSDDAVPLSEIDLVDRSRLVLDTCIVEHHVKPPEPLDNLTDCGFYPIGRRHIAGDRQHLATRDLKIRLHRLRRAVNDCYARTLGGKTATAARRWRSAVSTSTPLLRTAPQSSTSNSSPRSTDLALNANAASCTSSPRSRRSN
jgi:hypothetical protein